MGNMTRSESVGPQTADALDYRRLELIEAELIIRAGKNHPHLNFVVPA